MSYATFRMRVLPTKARGTGFEGVSRGFPFREFLDSNKPPSSGFQTGAGCRGVESKAMIATDT